MTVYIALDRKSLRPARDREMSIPQTRLLGKRRDGCGNNCTSWISCISCISGPRVAMPGLPARAANDTASAATAYLTDTIDTIDTIDTTDAIDAIDTIDTIVSPYPESDGLNLSSAEPLPQFGEDLPLTIAFEFVKYGRLQNLNDKDALLQF